MPIRGRADPRRLAISVDYRSVERMHRDAWITTICEGTEPGTADGSIAGNLLK